jgi:hypothetical protein
VASQVAVETLTRRRTPVLEFNCIRVIQPAAVIILAEPLKGTELNSIALVNKQTILTEQPLLVGEVSANFLQIEGCRVVSAADLYGCNLVFLDRDR